MQIVSNAELFAIPSDQMAHVQVLTVQPTTLTRTLRLTGAVAYNSFHTTPVITQVSGPVSRIVVPQRKCNEESRSCTWPALTIRSYAPITSRPKMAVGQLLQSGVTQCFMVSDTSNVWVLVNVYQKDLPNVRVGDPVTIQTESYPDVFHGRISYVGGFAGSEHPHLAGAHRDQQPGREVEEGHVCGGVGG